RGTAARAGPCRRSWRRCRRAGSRYWRLSGAGTRRIYTTNGKRFRHIGPHCSRQEKSKVSQHRRPFAFLRNGWKKIAKRFETLIFQPRATVWNELWTSKGSVEPPLRRGSNYSTTCKRVLIQTGRRPIGGRNCRNRRVGGFWWTAILPKTRC